MKNRRKVSRILGISEAKRRHSRPRDSQGAHAGAPGGKMRTILRRIQRAYFFRNRRAGSRATLVAVRCRRRVHAQLHPCLASTDAWPHLHQGCASLDAGCSRGRDCRRLHLFVCLRHEPGPRFRTRAKVFPHPTTSPRLVVGLVLTRTDRAHTVAALDSPDMPCC